jgi:Ca-activated chloride channel family protein
LVSDGEETCVPDPCPVKTLVGAGVDLQIDTVGFGVDDKTRQQLQCIADAGRGSYFDAKDASALTTSLNKLSQRALRPFTVSGKPVVAAPTPEAGPLLQPGQYTDAYNAGEPTRYYRLTRSPGSTVRFSVTARPTPLVSDRLDTEQLSVVVRTPSGDKCADETARRFDPTQRLGVMVATARVPGPSEATNSDPCHTATELVVAVDRPMGADLSQPVEVLYIEEPPVPDTSALPAAVDGDTVTPLDPP